MTTTPIISSLSTLRKGVPSSSFPACIRTDSPYSQYRDEEESARSKSHDEKFSQANSGRRIPQVASTGEVSHPVMKKQLGEELRMSERSGSWPLVPVLRRTPVIAGIAAGASFPNECVFMARQVFSLRPMIFVTGKSGGISLLLLSRCRYTPV